jgi:hypothetical protein
MHDLSSGYLFAEFRDFSRHLSCAVIGELSWSSAFVRLTHFIWIAKMADQTGGYALTRVTFVRALDMSKWQ